MTGTQNSTPEGRLTFDEFVDIYGGEFADFKGELITVKDAVLFEALCPIDEDKRQDPEANMRYLARRLVEKTLLPEHHYLLEQAQES